MVGKMSEDEIQQLLKRNSFGRLGCTDGENVYVIPINYRLEDNSIICYSLEGLKIDMMRKNPAVCFEIDEIKDTNHWKCLIITGFFEEITDNMELGDLRPRYTEYILRKRVTLTSVGERDNNLEKENEPNSLQVFYRIRFGDVSGRYEDGID